LTAVLECPCCDGSGQVISYIVGEIVGCDVCDGTGEIDEGFLIKYRERDGTLTVCDGCYEWAWCAAPETADGPHLCARCHRQSAEAQAIQAA
jgi:hypothetical protein